MRLYKSIFIWAVASLFFIMGCGRQQIPKVSKPPIQEKKEEQLENQEMEYLLKELKKMNPFRPDHAMGLAIEIEGGRSLKGIIWDSQRPFAIIADTVVVEGDYIDNKKVIRIDKNSVTLDNNGKEEVLRLEELHE